MKKCDSCLGLGVDYAQMYFNKAKPQFRFCGIRCGIVYFTRCDPNIKGKRVS